MDGILRCSRYAFGPNRLHYCGPDANREILAYIENGINDPGLETLLKAFQTMYPYLKHIAEANGIRDPFDERVVEAYWLGNELLENVEMKKFWRHLREDQRIEKRIGKKSFDLVSDKIRRGALPHHSFHVLDIWKRTGHLEVPHTLESMDECRISWGKVLAVDGPAITVEYEPLVISEGKLALGVPVQKKILRPLESDVDIEQLRVGDVVSMHWGVICEVMTLGELAALKKYTLRHIQLANQTI
ncbi:MAG: hypothetical protein A3B37_01970 [Candidatus Sungbacteria bacterium RIFCSPLOWO2_01_FULL_59_16]|uniref:Uncharacterized protein n=1 Tax=Candidatus Sungbacteria bacterium RIFCSPLOWO2_01_FULL_59_16 TaxID=1802280 RepID=A0A1G2LCV0_9BACT|nr:MAG: hypothetical protein A3B37_01970 [Candidatus Sungbacteria bacterium RIFCSPLOWO2_01_FULL_59_16]